MNVTVEEKAALCPCGSGQELKRCCEPVLENPSRAKTAEQLMRSRYVAFVLNRMDHVEKTHDPATREELDMEGNRQWAKKAKWKSLTICSTSGGGEADSEGKVEFVAEYEVDGQPERHHELSQFKKIKGQWYFVDGQYPERTTFERETPKLGRNDPCSCGSGKKFKKCCG